MSGLLALLRSRRFALALLMAIAALAVVGTLPLSQQVQERWGPIPGVLTAARALGIVETFSSPLFLVLAGALCASLGLCTVERVLARGTGGSGAPPGRPGVGRRVLDVLVHLSLLAIVAGGVAKGQFGFVRTRNIHVGDSAEAFYDFGLDADVPLGFTLEVLEREDTYYPLRALVGISGRASGKKIALVEAAEGRTVAVQGTGMTIEVEPPDAEAEVVGLQVTVDGRAVEVGLPIAAEGEGSIADVGAFRLTLVAWKRELKGVRTRLACRDKGVQTKEGWISPQSRLSCNGVSFAQTAWGVDEAGRPFTGGQAVRDPAAWLFWGGCVVFATALPLFLAARAAGRPRPAQSPPGGRAP